MKKIISISLLGIYLLLSVGVAKSTHLCMGRAFDVSYFTFNNDGCFGMKELRAMDCCTDELEVIKIEEDQNLTNFSLGDKQLYEISPVYTPLEYVLLVKDNAEGEIAYLIDDSPPPPKQPLYQLNCSLTYYG